jgi:dTMP kinase
MIIAFAGCDGAGKSTQVRNTANWLVKKNYDVRILDKWDILNTSKFGECRFINTELDDLRICIAEMEGMSRALFLFWSIAITLTKDEISSKDKIILLDGYWMKHAASEVIYGCKEDWILKTVEQFPKPELVLYLDSDPYSSLARKHSLTPYECGRKLNFTDQDFIEHQSKLNMLLKNWSVKYDWTRIPMLDANNVFSLIQQNISRYL